MTSLGVNSIVGSSIFLFPGLLAGHLGPASILSFGFTGLLLSAVALCFAEASTHYERAGGPILYATDAFGRQAGFAIGWLCWMAMIFSWAAVANAICSYLGYFGPSFAGPGLGKAVAAFVIVFMAAINYRGVKLGAWTSNFFTAAKLVPLVLLILAGLPRLELSAFTPLAPHGWRPMGAACFLAYFAFQGFENVPVPAGEVREPRKNIPRAVLLSISMASVVYMLVQTVAVGVNPGLAASQRPLADTAEILWGPLGAGIIVLGAVLSTVGFNAGIALGGPRFLVALAEAGHLPSSWAAAHPRFGTPSRCIALTAGLALTAALLLDFGKLVDIANVVICAQYAATCAAVPILRRRYGTASGAFRLPGVWAVPAAGVLATLWLGAQGGWAQVGWAGLALALGFALRAALR